MATERNTIKDEFDPSPHIYTLKRVTNPLNNNMASVSHVSVLGNNGSSFIIQKLQLLIREVLMVAVASDSPSMGRQQTCETLLCGEWGDTIPAVSRNPYEGKHNTNTQRLHTVTCSWTAPICMN